MNRSSIFTLFICTTLVLSGCQRIKPVPQDELLDLPDTWQYQRSGESAGVKWSEFIQSEQLNELLRYALENNQELVQKQGDLSIAKANLLRGKLRFWPELSGKLTSQRRKTRPNGNELITNDFTLAADLSYELNIWGQLSDAKKSAALSYAAAEADYNATLQTVVANVSLAWLDVIQSQQLVALYQQRLSNQLKNLNIIESGYRSGLSQALAVYLTRNDVEREKSRLLQQQQVLSDSRRALNVLLGAYPKNEGKMQADFPQMQHLLAPSLPSELLKNRPDLQAAWLNVLRQSAELAIAHKARFPSLRLTASLGQSSSELEDLVGDDNHVWSITAPLVQPLFAAGRLKAAEDIARARLEQQESRYINTVYRAFQEVESRIENQQSLQQQLTHTRQAADNALQAEKLAFDQYLKGLVDYVSVLDSQTRAVDAQIQVISLKRQISVNKIQLHRALAGKLDIVELPSSQ